MTAFKFINFLTNSVSKCVLALLNITVCNKILSETPRFFSGLYGTLFRRNKEAAFSNYRLWESCGFVIAYAYSNHICARTKLYVQLTVLLTGVFLYVLVEIHHMRKIRRQKEKEKKAAALEAAHQAAIAQEAEETDDEKDDIDDEIIVTHL